MIKLKRNRELTLITFCQLFHLSVIFSYVYNQQHILFNMFYSKGKERLFVSLTILLCCHDLCAYANDNILTGAASLAFVFDTTASMDNELVQAKAGAAKILATTLSQKQNPLYNYILVPFNDPGNHSRCFCLKSVSSECARDKSFVARKPKIHPKIFKC